ncbi:hypothetical protein BD779DRAFT_1550509, partial [Infundibulicybe gibba]
MLNYRLDIAANFQELGVHTIETRARLDGMDALQSEGFSRVAKSLKWPSVALALETRLFPRAKTTAPRTQNDNIVPCDLCANRQPAHPCTGNAHRAKNILGRSESVMHILRAVHRARGSSLDAKRIISEYCAQRGGPVPVREGEYDHEQECSFYH